MAFLNCKYHQKGRADIAFPATSALTAQALVYLLIREERADFGGTLELELPSGASVFYNVEPTAGDFFAQNWGKLEAFFTDDLTQPA
jgi:hypothetical protein